MNTGPKIRRAGRFWGTFLGVFGFSGVYTPWGIFIIPKYFHNRPLRRHEITHWQQRQRDGFIPYWLKTFWYLARYGYWNSPYEVEARQAQNYSGPTRANATQRRAELSHAG